MLDKEKNKIESRVGIGDVLLRGHEDNIVYNPVRGMNQDLTAPTS